MTVEALHAQACAPVEERIQYIARTVGVGKQLAACLLVQRDAQVFEERHRPFDRHRSQHLPDRRPRPSVEVALGHAGVGDVAPSAAADQQLRAGTARSIEQHDALPVVRLTCEDGGGEAGGTSAHDGDIGCRNGRP